MYKDKELIYFDNAATTMPKPECVIEAVVDAMKHSGNANRGTHDSNIMASMLIYSCRNKLAKMFGMSRPDQVIFTCNATESLNIAINGLVNPGDHVITTDIEHNSVLRPLYKLEKESGVNLSFIKSNPDGELLLDDVEKLIRPETSYLICSHASNVTGNVTDIFTLGKIAKKHKLIFIVDAAQTAGSISISMEDAGIDVLCLTGHKGLMGPQGTGALLINGDFYIRPFKTGGSGVKSNLHFQPEDLPTRLEAGTLNSHGIAGLSAAIDYINSRGIDDIHKYEMSLVEHFINGVKDIENLKLYGKFGGVRTATVSFNIGDIASSMLADILFQDYKIETRSGAHCAPRMHEALHTQNQGTVRFSFSIFNTIDEIDYSIKALNEITQKLI